MPSEESFSMKKQFLTKFTKHTKLEYQTGAYASCYEFQYSVQEICVSLAKFSFAQISIIKMASRQQSAFS
jgi:hypothetical protein